MINDIHNKGRELINVSTSKHNSSEDAFFSKPDMFSLFQNVNPNDVIEIVKSHKGISIYDLEKKSKINRNTLYYLLRQLEFIGITRSKLKLNENNRRVRLIFLNKKQKKSEASKDVHLNSNLNKEDEGDENN